MTLAVIYAKTPSTTGRGASGKMKPPQSEPPANKPVEQPPHKRQIDLPPPYTSIEAPKPSKTPSPNEARRSPRYKKIQEPLGLLAKRSVELETPLKPDGSPDDPNAVNLRDDTLERLTRIFDNILGIATRFQAPTFFESTIKNPHDDNGRI
ncbi:MAG: hypothetical protein RIB80_07545 [Rhodospirillales bacterium]